MTGRGIWSVPGARTRILYVTILGVSLLYAAQILLISAAGGTLGFDYRAYDLAVDRLFAGQPLYDPEAQATGGFGLFFYPPPFALMVVPFALLPTEAGVVAFTVLLVTASIAAIWLMPVSRRTRFVILLVAALSWPLVFAIKLGQVGPLILLTFALGWRWLDRPAGLGLSAAVGTAIKLQPAIVLGWAVLTGRLRAAALGLAAFAAIAVVATLAAGPASWLQELDLLRRVSQPVLTPHAFGPGRLLFEAGVPESIATAAHYANLAFVALVTLVATLRASAVASYLAVVIASQFLSPVLWDHYALVLLLPAAWLLDQGRWWGAAIPLATSTPLLLVPIPGAPWLYPIVFWAGLLAVTWEGVAQRRAAPG